MNLHMYWLWLLTYVLAWRMLVPMVAIGLGYGVVVARFVNLAPVRAALLTVIGGNLFDIVAISAALVIGHRALLPTLYYLPGAYGILWLFYGVAMAGGMYLSLWWRGRWLRRIQKRARQPPPAPPPAPPSA